MKGSETKILNYLASPFSRYVIPVYQRKYSWREDNCRQLWEDLKKIIFDHRDSHFFGSIVSSVVGSGATVDFYIIDGQQRITTVTLLLLAIRNLVNQKIVNTKNTKLAEQLNYFYLFRNINNDEENVKLCLVEEDRIAFNRLFGSEEDFDLSSKLTLNYKFFCSMILREEVTVDEIFDALQKLEIISITLDQSDNAQLIFESLNSTGLALEEGDKIRNFILMGLSPKEQNKFYNDYWVKIERCVNSNVSGFVRDYLSVKQQITPKINNVYQAFKSYAQKEELSTEFILKDLLGYAKLYKKLLTCKSEFKDLNIRINLDDCLYRMKRLDVVVTRPFFMEVLKLGQDGKISEKDVIDVFWIIENYLFRRNICEVPSNALNKVFLNLNREILRYDNTSNRYVEKLAYAILSKKESSRFPDDKEFTQVLAVKNVYQMRGKYKEYLFERFENYGTIETKEVYKRLDYNIYTIEHIMPQHLTPAWKDALGENADEIHEIWLHRLANLTLTGYNSNLSNKPFAQKRDAQEWGYKNGGFRMNQKISQKESWGLPELEERCSEMVEQAIKIWPFPETDFVPAEKEFDSCTLEDDGVDLTGLDIVKYSYQNAEQPVKSWIDMFEHVVSFLHSMDRSVLSGLAYGEDDNTLSSYVSDNEEALRSSLRIDDHIYIKKNTSTSMKISILRKLFVLYDADPMDLVFYLRDAKSEKIAETDRGKIRKKYWTYALPIIQEQNAQSGMYSNVNPATYNTISGYFGIGGFSIVCIANFDQARIDFYMGKDKAEKNKEAFDNLYSHKNEIEEELGIPLRWERADQNKASWISYTLFDVSIGSESDWPRMAKFHALWSQRIREVLVPYLQEQDDDNKYRLDQVAEILRGWTVSREGVNENPAKCVRTFTRFTTDTMTSILPDIPDAPSGWGTDNHYFYEIVNRTGNSVYIQFVISSKNITDEYRAVCDRINELYPARRRNWDWVWRTHFKTGTITFSEELSRDEIFAGLDKLFEEIRRFETELTEKLKSASGAN